MQQRGELMLPEGSAVPDSKLVAQSDGSSFSQLARASDLAAVQLGDDLRECPRSPLSSPSVRLHHVDARRVARLTAGGAVSQCE
jgi:hypothetical protein